MCGLIGFLILVGSVLYLADGVLHGFGPSTGFALVVLVLGVVSVYGWMSRYRQR